MADDTKVTSLASRAIDGLELSPAIRAELQAIQAELTTAYQKNFVDMIETMRRQASTLDRLQNTLSLLVQHVAPQLKDRLPLSVVAAEGDEDADLPSVVVADPIARGYTMTQQDLASALGLSSGDVSELVRAFKLTEDDCAITVRKGKRTSLVNYHPKAIERFKERIAGAKPPNLTANQQSAWRRVREALNRPIPQPPHQPLPGSFAEHTKPLATKPAKS